ncbi:MAG: hypothetical protein ACQEQE_03860 [Bacillota bacterium]
MKGLYKRKNENNLVKHMLDELEPMALSERTSIDYENLYNIDNVTNTKENKDDYKVKCMIIDNELYCDKIKS